MLPNMSLLKDSARRYNLGSLLRLNAVATKETKEPKPWIKRKVPKIHQYVMVWLSNVGICVRIYECAGYMNALNYVQTTRIRH